MNEYGKLLLEKLDLIHDEVLNTKASVIELLGGNELFEMANVHKTDSKLPVNLYFTCNGDANITNHNALRIKVQRTRGDKVDPDKLNPLVFHTTPGYETITKINWVGRAPKKSEISKSDLDKIINYVKQNWDTVVKHWCGELTDKQFLSIMPAFNPKAQPKVTQ